MKIVQKWNALDFACCKSNWQRAWWLEPCSPNEFGLITYLLNFGAQSKAKCLRTLSSHDFAFPLTTNLAPPLLVKFCVYTTHNIRW